MRPWNPANNILALTVGLASCFVACGGPEGPRYPTLARRLVLRIDGDQNGRVEAAEWNARSVPGASAGPGSFEALDVDSSGHLDAVELERAFLEIDPAAMQARLRAEARGKAPGAEGPAASIPGSSSAASPAVRPDPNPKAGRSGSTGGDGQEEGAVGP